MHGVSNVGLEFAFGRSNLLEIQHVEEAISEHGAEQIGWPIWPRCEGNADRHDRVAAVGMESSGVPHDECPPVVAHERCGVVLEMIEECDEVSGEIADSVSRDVVGDR